MGRQAAPFVPASPQADASLPPLTGVSAFAFQGTNAHVVLEAAQPLELSAAKAVAASRSSVWNRTRFWLAPQPHALLSSVVWSLQERSAVVQCCLDSAAAALLWQHQVRCCGYPMTALASLLQSASRVLSPVSGLGLTCLLLCARRAACSAPALQYDEGWAPICCCVQVQGRPIVPGAALLEATLAAAWALDADKSSSPPSLQGAAIPAPLLLPRQASLAAPSAHICLTQHGACSLASAGQQGQWTTHLSSQVTRLGSSTAACTQQRPVSAAWLPAILGTRLGGMQHGSEGPTAGLSQPGGRGCSWRCHPAIIDSSMHLALYARPADGRTRVPGALQALCGGLTPLCVCMCATGHASMRVPCVHSCSCAVLQAVLALSGLPRKVAWGGRVRQLQQIQAGSCRMGPGCTPSAWRDAAEPGSACCQSCTQRP